MVLGVVFSGEELFLPVSLSKRRILLLRGPGGGDGFLKT